MKKQPDKGKITALYERLSHDDERAGESVSIETQLTVQQKFQIQPVTMLLQNCFSYSAILSIAGFLIRRQL